MLTLMSTFYLPPYQVEVVVLSVVNTSISTTISIINIKIRTYITSTTNNSQTIRLRLLMYQIISIHHRTALKPWQHTTNTTIKMFNSITPTILNIINNTNILRKKFLPHLLLQMLVYIRQHQLDRAIWRHIIIIIIINTSSTNYLL